MSYKIIGDSCLDLTKELKKDPHFQMIPLTLQVDDVQVIDDDTFDQKKFLELVKASPNCPKSACPSPEMFKKAYECDAENVYVITLSSKLSGTYNSAVLAKELYEEEHGSDKNIAVIDSWTASCGQLNIALLIRDLSEAGCPFDEIIKKVDVYRQDDMGTYFVLESLDALRKNGRLTGLKAFFATTLNIKPIMGEFEGEIIKLDQARGYNKALSRMCEIAVKSTVNPESRRVIIAHCNNAPGAEIVKKELLKLIPFKEILITETAGISTIYASDGGIIVAM